HKLFNLSSNLYEKNRCLSIALVVLKHDQLKLFFMKIILLAFFVLPIVVKAQFKKSAQELATENITKYLSSSVLKDRVFKMVSETDIRTFNAKDSDISWMVEQQVETTDSQKTSDTSSKTIKQLYNFTFYLDRKFEVLRSD